MVCLQIGTVIAHRNLEIKRSLLTWVDPESPAKAVGIIMKNMRVENFMLSEFSGSVKVSIKV